MVNNARLILSDYGTHGWGVSSPDLPALISGAASREELTDEFLFTVACEAGLAPHGSITVYVQLVSVIDGEVFCVRATKDYHFNDRAALVFGTASHLASNEDLRKYAIRDSIGDAIFVVCLPGDTLRNAVGSLQAGATVTLAVERQDNVEYLSLIFNGPAGSGTSLSDLGLDMSSTVEELFARLDDDVDIDLSQIDAVRTTVMA